VRIPSGIYFSEQIWWNLIPNSGEKLNLEWISKETCFSMEKLEKMVASFYGTFRKLGF
jgi:hypothetical protein